MSLNRERLYQSFKFWRAQASSEKHPMRAPESTPWLSKARNKSTPTFRFTKQKKLAYAFNKSEHPFGEHYQTRPNSGAYTYPKSMIAGDRNMLTKNTAVKFSAQLYVITFFFFSFSLENSYRGKGKSGKGNESIECYAKNNKTLWRSQ